jgi:hypothetical protein
MTQDLTDEQTDALARLLSGAIDIDRYPLSPRIQTLKSILEKPVLPPLGEFPARPTDDAWLCLSGRCAADRMVSERPSG